MADQSELEDAKALKKDEQQQSPASSAIGADENADHEANDTPIQSTSGLYLTPQTPKRSTSSTSTSDVSSSLPSPVPSPRAPEPPRWRFVSDAKKSLGYNSSAAGMVVDGMSSEELGAKYVPPSIDSTSKPKERLQVGKLSIDETKNDGTTEGLRSCLRSFMCTGAVTDSDDGNDIGDVEVGSDWDKKSTIECAVVSDDEESKPKSTVEGSSELKFDHNKKRKACFLGAFLTIAAFAMILGVTLGIQNEDGDAQSSEDVHLNESLANWTASPSPAQNAQTNIVSSLPPAVQSMVRVCWLNSELRIQFISLTPSRWLQAPSSSVYPSFPPIASPVLLSLPPVAASLPPVLPPTLRPSQLPTPFPVKVSC